MRVPLLFGQVKPVQVLGDLPKLSSDLTALSGLMTKNHEQRVLK